MARVRGDERLPRAQKLAVVVGRDERGQRLGLSGVVIGQSRVETAPLGGASGRQPACGMHPVHGHAGTLAPARDREVARSEKKCDR